MLRITAVGAGAVDYLLKGCDDPAHNHRELAARADSAELGADRYFARAMEHGEPSGVWTGRGWEALGLGRIQSEIEAGKAAGEEDVRTIFGQLRRPDSPERDPQYIGSKPRSFAGYDERLAKLQAKEPDATPERLRELEREAASSGQRPVAYYDLTFSPVKSVSVLYAAYLAASLPHEAAEVRAAHDAAVKIALDYGEQHVAYTRFGKTEQGREYVQAEGLAAVMFTHHTSREGEPQLHTHGPVLNRVGTADGKIGALDGKAFRPFKEAIATAYERALEQEMGARLGTRFELRPDGKAREVVGIAPEHLDDASTRRGQVTARVEELVEQYRQRHDGHEPGPAARKAMADEATLSTRAAKAGLAGPAAVAAWVDREAGRRDRLAAAVDEVDLAAMAAALPVAASPERIGQALSAGLGDVQAKYSTWTIGNLVDAIDHHLGDASALGVPAAQRPAAMEALARRVVEDGAGYGVVQLTGHEPVAVPAALLRSDGRPTWRPHEERRFATADHLGTEAGVLSFAQTRGAQRVDLEQVAAVLDRAGLSPDQDAAVRGIATSGRHCDVLVGPAGTGKSRTVATLAAVWGESVGGPVYGVATSQIATSNLAGDGIVALNSTRFLDAVTPDAVTGRARRPLTERDLVVFDEASMAATPDVAAVATAIARAGAKLVAVGDPSQLDAVGAGGLFTYLTESLPGEQVHALEQAHRFAEPWEAEASLQLRAGDVRAVDAYADRGRLQAGTLEEMTAAARRSWLADRLDGLDSVLVVGTNAVAADMAGELRAELVALGVVRDQRLVQLEDGNAVGIGDVVESRRNAWKLRVDPSPEGIAEAVLNRGRYTILGRGDDGTILGRDRHGGIAHLPDEYVRDHTTLGYAVTVHGAEGVTVDTSNSLVDRDATIESVYVDVTRGRSANRLFMVTEREPDEHEPQRLAEVATERLTAIMEVRGAQQAASVIQAGAELEESSGSALLTRLGAALDADGHRRHLEALRGTLGDQAPERDDPTTSRLLAALASAELAGHDADALLTRAVESRSLDDVASVAETLRHRVRGLEMATQPAREVDAADWTSRLADRAGELPAYAREVAEQLTARQRDLGDRVAEEAPAWAATLGARPELDDERDAWRNRAGVAALYRERAGIAPEQPSLGAPPARDRPLDRALFDAALDATRTDGDREGPGRDWRTADDAELYTTRERWTREVEQAPEWVADQLADTHTLARSYREDAAIEAARARALAEDSPSREHVQEDADRFARFAERHEATAAELEAAHQRRASWWETSTPHRDADAAASDELDRRGLPLERVVDDEPPDDPEPEPVRFDDVAPQPAVDDREPELVVSEQEPQPEPEPDYGRDALEENMTRMREAAALVDAKRAARQAELDRAEREAQEKAQEMAQQRRAPTLDEVDREMSLDELISERKGLAPQLEPPHTELELGDDLEP